MKFLFIIFLSIAVLVVGNVFADEVEITSDEMISENKAERIIFTGNVVVKRGELTITTDRVEMVNRDGKREYISATGNVKVKQKDLQGEADKGIYYEKEGKIVLTGNPRAWEKDNKIEGEEIILLIKEDKAMVKGGEKKRVKAIFNPKEEKKP